MTLLEGYYALASATTPGATVEDARAALRGMGVTEDELGQEINAAIIEEGLTMIREQPERWADEIREAARIQQARN